MILGNPPYNAFAGTSPEEERGLVDTYKTGLSKDWGIKKFNLDDLYVRFFRIAEKRITEGTGRGVVSYISNFSYISDPSFVVMRRRLLAGFDRIWIDCLNGDSRETGKLTPDGKPDPSVFSTERNREGIRVGTAIGTFVKRGPARDSTAAIGLRQFWGTSKRAELLASAGDDDISTHYIAAAPSQENRFSFRPENIGTAYQSWPRVVDLASEPPYNGPIERRGNSLIALPCERDQLLRVADYLNPDVSDEEMKRCVPEFMKSSGEFFAPKARAQLLGRSFCADNIVPYPFKPFDVRVAYLSEDIAPLFSRPSPQLLHHRLPGNRYFITRDTADKSPEGVPFYLSPSICDYDFISGHARHFPMRLQSTPRGRRSSDPEPLPGMTFEPSPIRSNLSNEARGYLSRIGISDSDANHVNAETIWLHSLAIGFSPSYLTENADGLRQDWPRIPLPSNGAALLGSAALGSRIADLLDVSASVPGVTIGTIEPIYRGLGGIRRVDARALDLDAGDLEVTAGWGHGGKAGVVMPGRGRITDGGDVLDIWLNDRVYWGSVPRPVWQYTIGGYQVIKKWLSYREKALLGRALTPEEARYVSEMVRRIAALVAMQPELDANYEAVRSDTADFPVSK